MASEHFRQPSNVFYFSKSYQGNEIRYRYYSDMEQAIADSNEDTTILILDREVPYFPATRTPDCSIVHLMGQMVEVTLTGIGETLDADDGDLTLTMKLHNGRSISMSVTSADILEVGSGQISYTWYSPDVQGLDTWEEWMNGALEAIGGAISTTSTPITHSWTLPDQMIRNGDTGAVVILKNIILRIGIDSLVHGGGNFSHKRFVSIHAQAYDTTGTLLTTTVDIFGEAGAGFTANAYARL